MGEIKSVENILYEDMARREALDPQYFYEAKLPAIKVAQEAGLSDAEIELAFNIKIRPEDKKPG